MGARRVGALRSVWPCRLAKKETAARQCEKTKKLEK
jgi:hypothetical protein